MIDLRLDDKVVLVTGANNPFGIGAAIAAAFAAQDASVFITYLRSQPEEFGIDAATVAKATTPGEAFYRARNADTPDVVLGRLREHAVRVESAEVDLADPQAIPQLFERVEKILGPVDILINNAAHSDTDSFTPFPSAGDDWVGHILSTVDADSHDRRTPGRNRSLPCARRPAALTWQSEASRRRRWAHRAPLRAPRQSRTGDTSLPASCAASQPGQSAGRGGRRSRSGACRLWESHPPRRAPI